MASFADALWAGLREERLSDEPKGRVRWRLWDKRLVDFQFIPDLQLFKVLLDSVCGNPCCLSHKMTFTTLKCHSVTSTQMIVFTRQFIYQLWRHRGFISIQCSFYSGRTLRFNEGVPGVLNIRNDTWCVDGLHIQLNQCCETYSWEKKLRCFLTSSSFSTRTSKLYR